MLKLKRSDIASLMMLLWICVYMLILVYAPKWSFITNVIACTLPMLVFKQKYRGKTFGASNCNTVKYKKREYVPFFAFAISGTALISALAFLVCKAVGGASPVAASNGFLYTLVFSCMIPAFFEEWLLRGGVLGALEEYKGVGVIACSVFFMLIHFNFAAWPYALFAGLCITLLVYLTECIYLGMLLHFLINFTSMFLSYFSGNAEYIALLLLAIVFASSFALLKHSNLYKDTVNLFGDVGKKDFGGMFTPFVIIFLLCACFITTLFS